MGPILIFDKSLLQSLSQDESVWLDFFYLNNITPLFFIETLADLEKEVGKGRTPEQVVGNLAEKTPDLTGRPNVHHRTMLAGELSGAGSITMGHGQIMVSGGTPTGLEGRSGWVFSQTPEEEALNRWQRGEFLDLERQQAKAWRRGLELLDPARQKALFSGWFGTTKPRTLAEVKTLTDQFIDGPEREASLRFGLSLLAVSNERQGEIVARWRAAGSPTLTEFAPYFRHVLGVELFFYVGLAAGLISERRTNKVDIAYLYYLPFCMVFTSSDKLHAATVPLFLRPNQTFVPGVELKADLAALDRHYDALPDEAKQRGLYSFASRPPDETSFLVSRLWDKHMRPDWREALGEHPKDRDLERDKAIMEHIKKEVAAAEQGPGPKNPPKDSDNADYLVIKRSVRMKKGKWNRFPPEVQSDPE